MVSALVWVSMALIKYHEQKQLGEERFILPLGLQSVIRGSQGRNLEAGSEAEAVGKTLLTGLPSQLPYPIQDPPIQGHHWTSYSNH